MESFLSTFVIIVLGLVCIAADGARKAGKMSDATHWFITLTCYVGLVVTLITAIIGAVLT